MREVYEKSLLMIKIFDIKNEEEYNRLLQHYLVLSSESLKWMAGTRNFEKIVELAHEKSKSVI